MPEGNRLLLQRGALSFPHPFPERPAQIIDWMAAHIRPRLQQLGLF
jgi:hypothetical protein